MAWQNLGADLADLFGQHSVTGLTIEEALWWRGQRDLARLAAFQAENLALGLCRNCGDLRAAGLLHCDRCAAANRERVKRGRRERLAADPGLCISCARLPRRPGRTTCEQCKRFNRLFLDRRKAERAARAVCVVCGVGEPKPTARYCQPCHDKMRVRSRRQNKYQDQAENPKRVRLSPDLARQIRSRRAAGETIASLAAAYSVAESTICRVVKGQVWRD